MIDAPALLSRNWCQVRKPKELEKASEDRLWDEVVKPFLRRLLEHEQLDLKELHREDRIRHVAHIELKKPHSPRITISTFPFWNSESESWMLVVRFSNRLGELYGVNLKDDPSGFIDRMCQIAKNDLNSF